MIFTSEDWSGIPSSTPLGPLLKTIFYGTDDGIIDDFSQDKNRIAPQILIECRPEQRDAVTATFLSAIRSFVDTENKKIEEAGAENEEQDDEDGEWYQEPCYYYFPDIEIKAGGNGLAVYLSECSGFVHEESDMDPILDPLSAGLEALKNKYPNTLSHISLMYHIDEGYHYGYNVLWLDGEEKQYSALLLNFAIRQDDFWDEGFWEECGFMGGYEGLLLRTEKLIDYLDEDILDVFASHIPSENAERRDRLMEQIREFREGQYKN